MSRSNLPPEAQPWGRSIEDRITNAERTQANADLALRANAVTLGSLQGAIRDLDIAVNQIRDSPTVVMSEDSVRVQSGGVPDLYVDNVIQVPMWAKSARYLTIATFNPEALIGVATVRGSLTHYSDVEGGFQINQRVAVAPTSTLSDTGYPVSVVASSGGIINSTNLNEDFGGVFRAVTEGFISRTGPTDAGASLTISIATLAVFSDTKQEDYFS